MADNTPINTVTTPANNATGNTLSDDLNTAQMSNAASQSNPADALNAIAPAAGNPMANSAASTSAVNTAASTLSATGLASHTLLKPAAGNSQTVQVAPGEIISAQFDPNSANLSMNGKDLVMSFEDGSQIILQGFASDISNMPSISLPDGSLVAGGIVVAQLQGTNEDVFNLETAAGASAGGGGNFIYSDDMGGIIGLLDKLPPIDFSSLEFSQPEVRVTVADPLATPNVGGSFVPNITTTITDPNGNTAIVAGGFEDWQANQHIGDFTVTPMTLQIVFTPEDNEVVDLVTISNIPAGVQFFYLDANGVPQPLTITNGSITLSAADAASGNIVILPPGNSDVDIPFTISLFIRDPITGETAILSQNVLAVVDAVADQPSLDSTISIGGGAETTGTVNGSEGQPIALNINTTFPDNDGSEVHTVTIQGVPASWTLSDSQGLTFTSTVNPDGTVTYTAIVTGNVNHTVTFQPNNFSGTANITVISTATETVTDGELNLNNNTASVQTNFGVNITEDVPTLVAVTTPAIIPEASLLIPGVDQVNGTITIDFHTDGPGDVSLTLDGLDSLGLTSDGVPLTYTLSPDGQTITATAGGTPIFTIGVTPGTSVGNYNYTFTLQGPLDHAPGNGNNNLNIPVHFVATDSDGDTVGGNIPIVVVDDTPEAAGTATGTDETTHLDVPFTGDIPVDYGADGQGSLEFSNFEAVGSMTNGTLTSGGVPVTVTLVNGQYVGMAGSTVVFTMTLNPATNQYTFVQHGPLDHADGSNPNDIISLVFTYTATDNDGDTVTSAITINIRDDAPVAVADVNSVTDANPVATGNVMTNDTMSTDVTNTLQSVSVGGTTYSFSNPTGTDANGPYLIVQGTYGTLTIYQNGQYSYTYNDGNFAGTYTDQFNYTLVDFDGDTSTTTLTLNITDNGNDQPPVIVRTIDETTDIGNTISGDVSVPGGETFALTTATSNGSLAGGNLTSGGVPVTVSLVNGQYVGTAGGVPVFTLTLNPATGAYTFTQHGPLDHADGSNPNDVINLVFGYNVSDGNGNTVSGTITVQVLDDAPLAIADVNSVTDASATATGNVITNDTLSQDDTNTLQSVSFGGTTHSFSNPTGTDANGPYLIIQGAYGTLTIHQNGTYSYTYNDGNFAGTYTDQFNYTLVDHDGDTSSTTLTINITDNGVDQAPVIVHTIDETVDIGNVISGSVTLPGAETFALTTANSSGSLLNGGLSSGGVPVTVSLVNGQYVGMANGVPVFTLTLNPATGAYTFTQHGPLDHADGSNPNDVINLVFGYNAQDGNGNTVSNTITIHIRDDAPVAVADVNTVTDASPTVTGNVITNDTLSQDDSNTLQSVSFGGTTYSFSAPSGEDVNGPYLTIQGTYGTLTIHQNGTYSYTYHDNNFAGNYTDQFNYTLVDFDGDTSSTTLTINITDNGGGQTPVIVHTIDETVDIGNVISGNITVAGADTFALTTATSSGSLAGGNLTSGGVPVTISLVNGQYVGMAGSTPVFTLTLNPATGAYTFTQHGPLDHADGSNPNDVINLVFGYNAQDGSGNTVSNTITIHVRDDAPVAAADVNSVSDAAPTATGNVITNDTLSQDDTNTLQSVSFGGTTYSFSNPTGTDANGPYLTIQGAYGVLTIHQNGTYSYVYNDNNFAGNYVDQFNYTLVDYDGDTSSTTLTINITDNGNDQAPVIVRTIDETTDIGNTISGNVTVNGADHFGLTSASSSGSLMNGGLSSHGVPVTIALVNGQYVGTANGVPVFTLTLNPTTGAYTFVQHGPLDHADGSNPNDVINLVFGYNVSDANGNTVSSTITIHIRDDAPVAAADVNSVTSSAPTATGNVMTNDTLSHDDTNNLQSVSFAGTTYSFSSPSGIDANGIYLLVQGAHGVLKIYQNGNYSYTYNDNNFAGNYVDQFNYTLVDYDGDTSSTTLTINITDNGNDQAPVIVRTIDETTDIGNTISGNITVNGADHFGLTSATSSGSLAGGNLTSGGVAVTIALVNGQYVGTANGVPVFTLTLNPTTGAYTFTQHGPLDHADGSNPNDVINLMFGYNVSDANGNTVSSTITIHVRDDAPVAAADVNSVTSSAPTATGNVMTNDTLSHDGTNNLQSVSFGGTTYSFSSPSGIDANGIYLLVAGAHGVLKIYQNGNYTYTYSDGNFAGTYVDQFGYTIRDYDGDTSTTTLTINITDNGIDQAPVIVRTIDETTDIGNTISGNITVTGADHFGLTTANSSGSLMNGGLFSHGVPVSVALVNGQYVGTANGVPVFTLTLNSATGAYTFVQHGPLDHANGSNPNDVINLVFGYNAYDANGNSVSSTITINIRDDAPIAVQDYGTVQDNTSTATGNVLLNDVLSHDTSNLISQAGFGSNSLSFSSPSGYDSNGAYLLIPGAYGTLKLYQNGNYTYSYNNANHTGNHTEVFNYTIRDYDGDTSNTTLTINIIDSGPGVPPEIIRTVDETTDLGLAVNGTINVIINPSNPVTFALGNENGQATFGASGSMTGGTLQSHGVPIVVTLLNGSYVGMAGGSMIFKLTLNPATGQYQFIQYGPIDHANGSNPNDIINLNFSYTVSDADGDSATNHIIINVRDDAPIAVADVTSVAGGNTSVTGDVTTNDTLGVDSDTFATNVSHGMQSVNFGSNDTVTINGTYGQLVIHKDGSYTYNLYPGSSTPGNGATHTDVFNYTIRDYDGDTSTTTLTINSVEPKLVVGSNTGDTGGNGPGYHIGSGSGTIGGTTGNDILIGDVGGTVGGTGENFNIVMILDTSNSMNDGGKLALLKAAVANLLADFNDYNGGTITVRFITFNNNVQSVGTFTVTNAAEYQAALNFVNGLTASGETNYEAPLMNAIQWLQSGNTIPGATNFTYFISDGEPNRYINPNGGVSIGSATQSMSQITGGDGSNEVGTLHGLSTVVSVGVGVNNTTMGHLNVIDSDGQGIHVQNPNDLNGALQGSNPIPTVELTAVGNDTINGGDGNDLIFGDSVNTDVLAHNMGVNLPAGSGWAVFDYLEANHPGWTRQMTINYINSHLEELARETHLANGDGRTGGHDTITGGNGNDIIFGQEGNDTINGGAGNDIIAGGSGNNILTGGLGSDTFLFIKGSTGHDTITDYSNAQNDRLDISDLLVGTGYTPGGNANNYVHIDASTGQVFVDVTGSGNFNSSNHIATINNINSMNTINVILNDNEGIKVIHTV